MYFKQNSFYVVARKTKVLFSAGIGERDRLVCLNGGERAAVSLLFEACNVRKKKEEEEKSDLANVRGSFKSPQSTLLPQLL